MLQSERIVLSHKNTLGHCMNYTKYAQIQSGVSLGISSDLAYVECHIYMIIGKISWATLSILESVL